MPEVDSWYRGGDGTKQKAVQKWSCSFYRAQRTDEVKLALGNVFISHFSLRAFYHHCGPADNFDQMIFLLLCLYIQPGRKKDKKKSPLANPMKYFNAVNWVWAPLLLHDYRYLVQGLVCQECRAADFGGENEKKYGQLWRIMV